MVFIVIDLLIEIYCCCYSSPFCHGFGSKLHCVAVQNRFHRIAPAKCLSTGKNQKGDARGVEVPDELWKELPQKKWEQAARQVLRTVEPKPDFNVAFLTEHKWRLTARAGDPDQWHVNVKIAN